MEVATIDFENKQALGPVSSARPIDPYSAFLLRLGPGSRRTMRYNLQVVADLLGCEDIPLNEIPWHQIEREHVLALVGKMEAAAYSGKTTAIYLSGLRGVLTECWQAGLISMDKLQRLKSVRPLKQSRLPRGQFVPRSDFDRLLDACEADRRVQGIRDAAILSILYGSGLRRAESVNIDLANLDQVEWSTTVIGKGNKELKKWLSPGAVRAVKRWLEVRQTQLEPVGPLFVRIRRGDKLTPEPMTPQAIYYLLAERGKQAGVNVKPHDLRRTFVTRMIERHGEGMAQKLADHANVATTLIYDMRGDKAKRDAIQSEPF